MMEKKEKWRKQQNQSKEHNCYYNKQKIQETTKSGMRPGRTQTRTYIKEFEKRLRLNLERMKTARIL